MRQPMATNQIPCTLRSMTVSVGRLKSTARQQKVGEKPLLSVSTFVLVYGLFVFLHVSLLLDSREFVKMEQIHDSLGSLNLLLQLYFNPATVKMLSNLKNLGNIWTSRRYGIAVCVLLRSSRTDNASRPGREQTERVRPLRRSCVRRGPTTRADRDASRPSEFVLFVEVAFVEDRRREQTASAFVFCVDIDLDIDLGNNFLGELKFGRPLGGL
ncbi:hypothetical protein M5K25_011016 [Dendrobium thyrsiflorum]|uniref:Uncharacterized protein n=1 Tax=Dendrobium thyrsiflorum TaxID=117978 RepID=A0ABD0V174_DENTH